MSGDRVKINASMKALHSNKNNVIMKLNFRQQRKCVHIKLEIQDYSDYCLMILRFQMKFWKVLTGSLWSK